MTSQYVTAFQPDPADSRSHSLMTAETPWFSAATSYSLLADTAGLLRLFLPVTCRLRLLYCSPTGACSYPHVKVFEGPDGVRPRVYKTLAEQLCGIVQHPVTVALISHLMKILETLLLPHLSSQTRTFEDPCNWLTGVMPSSTFFKQPIVIWRKQAVL